MPSLRRDWYESSHKMITILALGIIFISNCADFGILLAVIWTDENFKPISFYDLIWARAIITFFVAFFSGLAVEKMYKKKKNTKLTLKSFLSVQIANLTLSPINIIQMITDENKCRRDSPQDLLLLSYSWSITLALLVMPAYLTIIVYSYLGRMENRLLESSTSTFTEECLVRPSHTNDEPPPPPYEMVHGHI